MSNSVIDRFFWSHFCDKKELLEKGALIWVNWCQTKKVIFFVNYSEFFFSLRLSTVLKYMQFKYKIAKNAQNYFAQHFCWNLSNLDINLGFHWTKIFWVWRKLPWTKRGFRRSRCKTFPSGLCQDKPIPIPRSTKAQIAYKAFRR